MRYLYYITAAIRWTRLAAENGHGPTSNSERLEVRTALPIWTLSYINGLTSNEAHYGESGIVPPYALEIEIQWKESSSESTWTWAADANARNGEERVSTPKSDGGSAFTSPTKSISFDRSYSISSRATPLQLDPSFVTPSSSRRDLFSTSASLADLSTPSASIWTPVLVLELVLEHIGVTARLDGATEEQRGEEVEESQEEAVDGPPLDVGVELVQHNVQVVGEDEEDGDSNDGQHSVLQLLVQVRVLVLKHGANQDVLLRTFFIVVAFAIPAPPSRLIRAHHSQSLPLTPSPKAETRRDCTQRIATSLT